MAWQHRDMNFYTPNAAPDKFQNESVSADTPSISEHTCNTERKQRPRRHRSRQSRADGASVSLSTPSEHSLHTVQAAPPTDQNMTPYMLSVDPVTGASMIHSVQPGPQYIQTGMPMLANYPASALGWDPNYQMAYQAQGHMTVPPAPPPYTAYQLVAPMAPLVPTTGVPGVYDMRAETPHSLCVPMDARPEPVQNGPKMVPKQPEITAMPQKLRPRPIVLGEDGAASELPMRDPKKLARESDPGPNCNRARTKYQGVSWSRGLRYVLATSGAMVALGVVVALVLMFITV